MSNYTTYKFKCGDDEAVERMLEKTQEEDTCCKGYWDENGDWIMDLEGDVWTYNSEEELPTLLYLYIDNKEIWETIGYFEERERGVGFDYTGEPIREYDPDDFVEGHIWLNRNNVRLTPQNNPQNPQED